MLCKVNQLSHCAEACADLFRSTASLQVYESGDATSLYGCIVTATQSQVAATWVQEDLGATAVTSNGPITIIAAPLYMVWHESDTSLHVVSDANSLRAAMGMALPSSKNSVNSATPTATVVPAETSSHGISSGAIGGIAAGFAVCLIVLAILGYLAFARRNRIKQSSSDPSGPAESQSDHTNAWSSRTVYGGPLYLQTSNTVNKSPSSVDLHHLESGGSRTPQSPFNPQAPSRAKDEDMFAVEQKMLIR